MKWQYPAGLLFDLFSSASPHQAPKEGVELSSSDHENGQNPWQLRLHFSDWPDQLLVRPDAEGKTLHDAFINSVKEADFLRNGTARGIMSLSKEDSEKLWDAVQRRRKDLMISKALVYEYADACVIPDDQEMFRPIQKKMLYAQGVPLRHVPFKIYLPSSPSMSEPNSGHLRVVQSLVTPRVSGSREPQSLGTVLHSLLPALFPSRKTTILAKAVLHGATVPLSALIEDLMRQASYLDGWLHLGIIMIG